MQTVLLIIQFLVAAGLTGVILMQRSEGGALGIGGGGGGMMSSRGAANVLTRTTMVLGAVFIGNAILLAVLAGAGSDGNNPFDRELEETAPIAIEDEEPANPVPTDG